MKKRILGITLALCAFVTLAFASDCYVANKPDGAGNIGNVVIRAATGNVVSLPTNPDGQTKGGFVDVYLDVNGDGIGDINIVNDTFLLPQQAPGLTKEGGLPEIPIPETQTGGNGVNHYH